MSHHFAKNGSLAAPAGAASEVVARGGRRRFTAEYKLRILNETDRCVSGEIGAVLRREGLYSSHLSKWRQLRQAGQLTGLAPQTRGRKPQPQAAELMRLQKENARLQTQLEHAGLIIEAQKKLFVLLNLPPLSDNEST
jgi:transposase